MIDVVDAGAHKHTIFRGAKIADYEFVGVGILEPR
jgi:hypothetical protein